MRTLERGTTFTEELLNTLYTKAAKDIYKNLEGISNIDYLEAREKQKELFSEKINNELKDLGFDSGSINHAEILANFVK